MAKSSSKNHNPFGLNDIRKSSDKVPQPKGKFRDLFLEMQEKSAANKKRSAQNDNHSQ